MTPRPFLTRLILPFALAMAAIVVVCGAVVYWGGERTARRQQIQDLDRLASLVRQWIPGGGQISDAEKARLADSARVLGTRITLIDGDGKVILDTDAAPESMENHNDRPEVIEARRAHAGSGVRFSNTLGEKSVYVARLVDPARPDGLVLRLSYPQHVWADIGPSAWAVVAAAVACALLVTALLWLILQRLWINPVRRLAAAAERMAAGQWEQRVDPDGAEDVRFFSAKLNLVASQAERQLADLRHQRADLRALVDTLPDPILAIDYRRRVSLLNPPAAALLEVRPDRGLGELAIQAVAEPQVLALIEEALRTRFEDGSGSDVAAPAAAPTKRSVRGQIHVTRHGHRLTYDAVAVPTAGGGAVLVLRDVSALAATLQMKTDFVANASHELRTPIAALKVAFETLAEVHGEDPAQAERCIRIMDGHMKRLEEMLRDLMDLSRVESAEIKPSVQTIKASDVYAQVRAALAPIAREKGVELRYTEEGVGGPVRLLTDERLLNLVLKNLVENSIKFTPAGGRVAVTARLEVPPAGANGRGAEAVIRVEDTGIGIPPEHLDRVFERFYQVDAARSGSAGRGTGLGLAIVKHAVAALGGTVELESTVGSGTTVTCLLPQEAAADVGKAAET